MANCKIFLILNKDCSFTASKNSCNNVYIITSCYTNFSYAFYYKIFHFNCWNFDLNLKCNLECWNFLMVSWPYWCWLFCFGTYGFNDLKLLFLQVIQETCFSSVGFSHYAEHPLVAFCGFLLFSKVVVPLTNSKFPFYNFICA